MLPLPVMRGDHRGFRFRQLQILRSQPGLFGQDFHSSGAESDSVMVGK